ncbi:unnamed protein product, partial [Mesorhabditis belari]|uniref:C-type lectin domain-containing protein n=1 Tax=Mesorhabditis belari TaxID=2138241 RepID=A0AAF3F737_9BILA
MPEDKLPEKSVKRIEEQANSLKKIAQLEADLEEMKKHKEAEMSRWAEKIAQIEANLKIAKLEADLVDERERNRELERKIAEAKRKNDDLEAQLRTQDTEMRDGKAKIGELEGKINALQSKISGFETQIQFERESKTAEMVTWILDLEGWSYLAKTASWYKIIEQNMTFDKAEAYCASRKIHLVSIHSPAENDFVQELAETVHLNCGFWIGLKRNPNKENAFEWTDGSAVDFTNWRIEEPNSNPYVHLHSSDGIWRAYSPTNQYRFICKRSFQF